MHRTTPALFLFASVAALFLTSSDAFTMQTSRSVQGLHSRTSSKKMLASILKMSGNDEQAELLERARKLREEASAMEAKMREAPEEPKKAAPAATSQAATSQAATSQAATSQAVAKPNISADGTFYDDEVDSAPQKDGISDSMKARLMREASTGLDSNQSQTNVILYICAGVAVLVALGGSGILY